MSVKLRDPLTVVLSGADMARVLTDALCGTFSSFDGMVVYYIVQSGGDFRVELERPALKPVAVQKVNA